MFFAQLCGDHGYIRVPADRMVVEDNVIYAYLGERVTAIADVSVVLFAHISGRNQDAEEWFKV